MSAAASTDLFPITLTDQVACLGREIRYREQVYPRLISAGKLTREKADREIAVMRSIEQLLATTPPGGPRPLGPPWPEEDLYRIAKAVRALDYAFRAPNLTLPRSIGMDTRSISRLRSMLAPLVTPGSAERLREDGGVEVFGIHFFIDDGAES